MSSSEILLSRENMEEVERRARLKVNQVIDHLIETMIGSDQLVVGQVAGDRRQRVLLFEDLATRGVIAEMMRLNPDLTQKVYIETFERDRKVLGLERTDGLR